MQSHQGNHFCNFCHGCGIPGPHDHTLRDFSKRGNPINCQKLLNIKCEECQQMGHTKMYCHKKTGAGTGTGAGAGAGAGTGAGAGADVVIYVNPIREENIIRRAMRVRTRSLPNEVKETDDTRRVKQARNSTAVNVSSLTARFSGIDVDSDADADADDADQVDHRSSQISWANIVRSGRKSPSIILENPKSHLTKAEKIEELRNILNAKRNPDLPKIGALCPRGKIMVRWAD